MKNPSANSSEKKLGWFQFQTLMEREVRRFLKVAVQTVITPLVNSALYLLIFGVSLGAHIKLSSGVNYMAFLIPGLVMMAALNNAFQNSSSSVISAKFSGDIEDLKVAPLSNMQILWAYGVGGVSRGLIVGLMTWLMGQVFYVVYQGGLMGVAHPLLLIFFLFVGTLSFAFLGLTVAFWARNFDQLAAVNGFVLLPLIYLGGVFFALDSLHPFWKKVASLNPLLYFINGVRYGFIGVSDVSSGVAAAVSLVSLGLFYFLAYTSLQRGRFARW